MAKSMRSKREKRLRAIRRDMVGPLYEKKDAAKLAVLEAALAAPKLPVNHKPSSSPFDMDVVSAGSANTITPGLEGLDLQMLDGDLLKSDSKPLGTKVKKKLKLARNKPRGKGKFKRRHI